MEFQIDKFKGKVDEPIRKKITFFKVSGEKKGSEFIPMIFWLITSDKKCNRFFMDAWMLHWTEYTQKEMEELIKEDFEESDTYRIIDLMLDYNLADKLIRNVEVDYLKETESLTGKLWIEIEGSEIIELLDFGDEKEQELKINDLKIGL
ncbi:hypothetical protein [Aquimarina latercula]|uniref:hypothetical protein n=1 Tax=Aquimarina latercula TaxID=987 RepID=UPI000413DCBD|nr:hypothetical protein [Aquimarina latercula]